MLTVYATRTGCRFGSKAWVQSLEQHANRRLAALPVGRPRAGSGEDGAADLFWDGEEGGGK